MPEENTAENKLWTRDFILVIVLTVFTYLSKSVISSTYSTYVVDHFHGSSAIVGTVSSLDPLSHFLFRPFAGYIIDRYGRRKTLLLAFLFACGLNLALLLPMGIFGLGLIRFALGFPFTIGSTGSRTLTADVLPQKRFAEGFSYYSIIFMLVSSVAGPNLGFFIIEYLGFPQLFILAGIFALIAIIVLLNMRFKDIRCPNINLTLGNMLEKDISWLALSQSIAFMGSPGLLSFGPLYAKEVGLSSIGLFLTVYGLGVLSSQLINRLPITSHLQLIRGVLVLVITAGGFLCIGLISSPGSFLIGVGLMGLGLSATSAVFAAMAVEKTPEERHGACSATLIFGQDFGVFIGSFMFGQIAEATQTYRPSYLFAGFVVIISLLIFIFKAYPQYKNNPSYKKSGSNSPG